MNNAFATSSILSLSLFIFNLFYLFLLFFCEWNGPHDRCNWAAYDIGSNGPIWNKKKWGCKH